MVRRDLYSLQYVPDWFVTEEQIDVWYYDDEYCGDGELIEWYNDCHRRKAQKAKLKEELMLIAWHPDRVMDWSIPEDEKRRNR